MKEKIRHTKQKFQQKLRKKGSITIELIAAIPIFIFMIWAIMNIMLYVISSSQLTEAANETARALAMELRGKETDDLAANIEDIDKVKDQIASVVSKSPLVRLNKAPNEVKGENATTNESGDIITEAVECHNEFQTERKNIICAYITGYEGSSGATFYQVEVRIRSAYQMTGGFSRIFYDHINLNAYAVSQVELPGRTNYVEY